MTPVRCRTPRLGLAVCLSMLLAAGVALPAAAGVTPFTRAVAEAAGQDEVIGVFYRERGYRTLFTGQGDSARREALLTALAGAAAHGLPVRRYDAAALVARFRAAETQGDRARLEVAMTRALLDWAHDLSGGALDPAKVDPGIKRETTRPDPRLVLARFEADPVGFLNTLPPRGPAYVRLMRARLDLERQIAGGGWGPEVPAAGLARGGGGPAATALRDRLAAMGYLGRSVTATFDDEVAAALRAFQFDQGLPASGAVDEATRRALNVAPEERLASILVALERERWMDVDRSERQVWVNLTEFTARLMEGGRVLFETRAVIGKDADDMRSPEFSDRMEYMVVNPSWSVPRSIATREYLPLMQRNPRAAGHLMLVDRRGRTVSRGSVNFNAYNARNFPYSLRQPPSDGNALGLVKFMFPNPWNIYLHDTPSKSLFEREVRAFSHGCIRLGEPFEFAYALLRPQSDDPQRLFQAQLKTGREGVVRLQAPLPVHLVYFTAWAAPSGRMNYRPDVYGRDAAIRAALAAAGVVSGDVRG